MLNWMRSIVNRVNAAGERLARSWESMADMGEQLEEGMRERLGLADAAKSVEQIEHAPTSGKTRKVVKS